MSKNTLKAVTRDLKKKKEGFIKAVLYGRDVKNEIIWVDEKAFTKVYSEAGGSTLIDVIIGEKADKRAVLIYDVQIHPLTGDFVHIDFYQVDMNEEIETDIELIFKGIAPAVKELGGTFVKSIDKLPVRCLPSALVNHIDVDISMIATFDNYIHVKDLNIPDGLEVTLEDDVVIALATPPRTAAEMEALDEEIDGDISQVEGMEEKETDGAGEANDEEGDKKGDADDKKEE